MTTAQVAKQLNVSEATVNKWADEGTLPCYRLSGSVIRFRASEIEKWIEDRRQELGRNTTITK